VRDVELPVEKRGHNDSCLAATSWHDPGYVINLRVVRTMTAVVWMHPRLIDQRHDEATTSYRNPFTVFPTFLPAGLSRGNRRRCQTLRHSTPKTSVSTACAKQHSHAVTHNVGHRSALRVRDAVAFSTTQGIAHTKFFLPLNCCRVGGDDR
jgi:hypothetical protein